MECQSLMMEKRRLLFVAAPIACLLMLSLLFAEFISFNQWMQSFSSLEEHKEQQLKSLLARLVRGKDRRNLEETGFGCDVAENSIVCIANTPVRVVTDGNVTVYVTSRGGIRQEEASVKPYALQKDKYLLQYITAVKILDGNNESPACEYNHQVPAVIFSTGISGNIFHEFNDIIIPLYITTKHFQSKVQFILEDYSPAFVDKFSKIISRLSSFDVLNPGANTSVHCFPATILGLKYHDNLALNPKDIPGGYSMHNFRKFIWETYGLKYRHVSQIKKPRLVFISRDKSRKILNEDDMISMIQELGFQVVVARAQEARNINKFANTVNSCCVLVGAHGAGLTNELFLADGAVMVQIEPLGIHWAAENYYGYPARAMHVQYLQYKIEPEESTLTELYGRNHPVITDPELIYAKGYRAVRAIYLDKQDITVDIVRFQKIILEALKLLKRH